MHAKLLWRDGLPYSTQFEDTYFSVSPEQPQHGLAETRHVFLQHNRLKERWQALAVDRPSPFVIVETGFGSGLNFLAAVQHWRETAPPNACLLFISTEIAPFSLQDLQKAHAVFPALADVSLALCQQYRLLQPGMNQLVLPEFNTVLRLFIGDCADFLPTLNTMVDAWFLDGFAPAKNPQMWQPVLFDAMARCASPATTFATFTSAGMVRRALQHVGFIVQKVAGYGAKREMLCGYWLTPVAEKLPAKLPKVAVIGAGIAGASTAWHLATFGCEVTVYEREAHAARGASGNPRGMLYPRLNTEKAENDQLALNSFCYTVRLYHALKLGEAAFDACGLLQLGATPREFKRVHKVAKRYTETELMRLVSPAEASAIANVEIAHDCLYFPEGAWVNPVAACHTFLSHPQISKRFNHTVTACIRQPSGWQLQTLHQPLSEQFDVVVIANAVDAVTLLPDEDLPLRPIRGQMGMIATNRPLGDLKTILCGDGYVTPETQGVHALGASFCPADTDTEIRESENQSNLAMISRLSPAFSTVINAQTQHARAALRCGTPNYLPIYRSVDKPAFPNMYLHVGHGSKGLMTAPYCAQQLVEQLVLAFNER